MNWTQKQILQTGELLHHTDASLRDISSVVGIPESKLLSDFAVSGRSALDVLLVVVCNELLTVKIGTGCEYHSFGLGIRLLHRLLVGTTLSMHDIDGIRADYTGRLSLPDEGLDERMGTAIVAWKCAISTITSGLPEGTEVVERTENFLRCVREVTSVDAHPK